jgi:hypothetical protein
VFSNLSKQLALSRMHGEKKDDALAQHVSIAQRVRECLHLLCIGYIALSPPALYSRERAQPDLDEVEWPFPAGLALS